MSHFGEHAAGWLALGGVGALLAPVAAGTGCWSASGRRRARRRDRDQARGAAPPPHHPDVAVNVDTPSSLSFPSAHATSSTAAAILLCRAPVTAAVGGGAADGAVAAGARCALSHRRSRRDRRRRGSRGVTTRFGAAGRSGPGEGKVSDHEVRPRSPARPATCSQESSRRSGPGSG